MTGQRRDPDRRGQPAQPEAGARRPRALGYATLAAESAEDGVALAARAAPALMLMDVQLPGHRRRRGARRGSGPTRRRRTSASSRSRPSR